MTDVGHRYPSAAIARRSRNAIRLITDNAITDDADRHMPEPILAVENLRTYFRPTPGSPGRWTASRSTSNPGETLGIVGESGSGKSVTSLSVMRLIPQPPGRSSRARGSSSATDGGGGGPGAGERGADAGDPRQRHRDDLPGADDLAQPGLPGGRADRRVAAAPPGAQRSGTPRDRAIEMLQLVGIPIPEQRVDEYPHQLSGGMRQRVMIAMALACDPKLLIADEPTTALDVTIQAQILELLNRLQEELGMSIILITHDLGVVAETCDRVIVMYAGQVFEEGPVDDVFHDPQNPYTEGLLRSIPRLGSAGGAAGGDPRRGAAAPPTGPPGAASTTAAPTAGRRRSGRSRRSSRSAPGRKSKCWLVENPERREEVRRTTGGFTAGGRAHRHRAPHTPARGRPGRRRRPRTRRAEGEGS